MYECIKRIIVYMTLQTISVHVCKNLLTFTLTIVEQDVYLNSERCFHIAAIFSCLHTHAEGTLYISYMHIAFDIYAVSIHVYIQSVLNFYESNY